MSLRPSCSRKRDVLPAQKDLRDEFYEAYHNEAEGYDKDFMDKYNGDLDTSLIFVSFMSSSGGVGLTR